jgi:hypothetical protein
MTTTYDDGKCEMVISLKDISSNQQQVVSWSLWVCVCAQSNGTWVFFYLCASKFWWYASFIASLFINSPININCNKIYARLSSPRALKL